MSKKHRKYRIKDKYRFFLSMFILCTITILSFFLMVVPAKAVSDIRLVPIYIEEGDTLWDLSEKYSEGKADIRRYITMVMEINHLQAPDLKPGKLLYFPQLQ